ncbi:type II secretion system protein [Peptoclostridium litorale]|nr:type II secretion system protein [Peptoclostridium litorale]
MKTKGYHRKKNFKLTGSILKKQVGFTLIELVVVIAVITALLIPLAGIFNAGYDTFYREDENVKITRCARTAMERTVEAIRKADALERTVKIDGETVKEYYYDIEYVSESSIKVNGKSIDETYAFDDIDGADELEGKNIDIEIYLDNGDDLTGSLPDGRKIARVKVMITVTGKRIGDYYIETQVYLRNN